jgi:tRNA(fMet)-specific endonuclease VapC
VIRFLIDTDICSYFVKRRYPSVVARHVLLHPDAWAISAITYAEIRYGLEALPLSHPLQTRMDEFLRSARVLDWPASAAVPYAHIRHRAHKQPLNDRDIFIAAHAIVLDATLVTNNTRHFSRMGGGLRFENWLEDSHPGA